MGEHFKGQGGSPFGGGEEADVRSGGCVCCRNTTTLRFWLMSAVLAMFCVVQLLEKELDDHGQKQLRIVCDSDMDDKLSARELGEHFPRSVSLVQQVSASLWWWR